jgi:hypothetical protein
MRNMIKLLSLVLCIGLFNACEDSQIPSFVYGTVEADGNDAAAFQGTLVQSDDYVVYGYCKVKGGNLNFAVGHAPAGEISRSSVEYPVYISIAGVKGPPVKGVFDFSATNTATPPPRDNPALYTTFTNAIVVTDEDQWTVTPATATYTVELFATPAVGEVIFEVNKSFDYYVRLECSQVVNSGQNGTRLSGFSAELFFENCS